MARKTTRYYFEMLKRSAAGLRMAQDFMRRADPEDEYDIAFRKTAAVKQFELVYEALIKLMFKAADRLPEPEPRATPLTWKEAHRMWRDLGIGELPEAEYNKFKRIRNLTAHTYNIDAYEELVAPQLDTFRREVEGVLTRIEPLIPDES